MKNILLILLSFIILLPNSNIYAGDNIEKLLKHELEALDLKNPQKDLAKRMKHNDFRFIGLYGYTIYFPGVDQNDSYLTNKYGVLPIKGTSDCIMSQRHLKLIQQAQHYAKIYNTTLFSYIKDKSPPSPTVDIHRQNGNLPLLK